MAYTTINDPSAHFQTMIFTGDGNDNRALTNDGNSDLQPDWIWFKNRVTTNSHNVLDSTRGVGKTLEGTNSNSAEGDTSTRLTSFDSDGFTVKTDPSVNGNTNGIVAWQWKANGGTRTTNAESGNNPAGGYQVNTTAGFSIVDYVGTGAAGTMAHGLGVVPNVIIVKNRDVADAWAVYHSADTAAPATDYLVLNTNAATVDDAAWWNDTAPTSSVFTVNTNHSVNADAENYIAYCFTEKQGYSKFGSYVGNANADGAFVYTGFKPAFVMLKGFNHAGQWVMQDTTRRNYQGDTKYVYANLANAEGTNSALAMDFLSNGFKLRSADDAVNSGDYIYMAFAEQPFVTSTGIPATAR
jgi:hypothetical protein